jgi:hypothetical protein
MLPSVASLLSSLVPTTIIFIDEVYVFEKFCDIFSKDMANWGIELGFHYGPCGNWRIDVQLLGQLDDIELHLRCETPLSSLHAYFHHVKF